MGVGVLNDVRGVLSLHEEGGGPSIYVGRDRCPVWVSFT